MMRHFNKGAEGVVPECRAQSRARMRDRRDLPIRREGRITRRGYAGETHRLPMEYGNGTELGHPHNPQITVRRPSEYNMNSNQSYVREIPNSTCTSY